MHNPDITINDNCKIENSIVTFKLQDGPIKDVGVNGAQIDDLIQLSREIIDYFNTKFPCRENSIVLTKLDEAMLWMYSRTKDREKRKVEGQNKI